MKVWNHFRQVCALAEQTVQSRNAVYAFRVHPPEVHSKPLSYIVEPGKRNGGLL